MGQTARPASEFVPLLLREHHLGEPQLPKGLHMALDGALTSRVPSQPCLAIAEMRARAEIDSRFLTWQQTYRRGRRASRHPARETTTLGEVLARGPTPPPAHLRSRHRRRVRRAPTRARATAPPCIPR